MVYSSYYVSNADAHFVPPVESFFVVNAAEGSSAQEIISDAVSQGARAVVLEWGVARANHCLSCSNLVEGVSYVFVRSIQETLGRWNAVPRR